MKSLGLGQQEIQRLNNVNAGILGLELKKVKFLRYYSFLQGTIINSTRASILFLTLWLLYNRSLTLGEFYALFFYSFPIFSPLAELGAIIAQYQEAKASMEKLEEVLSIPPEPNTASTGGRPASSSFPTTTVTFASAAWTSRSHAARAEAGTDSPRASDTTTVSCAQARAAVRISR